MKLAVWLKITNFSGTKCKLFLINTFVSLVTTLPIPYLHRWLPSLEVCQMTFVFLNTACYSDGTTFFFPCKRLHAEFQLNERSNVPFWFTPAQFTGSLIISHDLRHIQYFKIYVPAKRRLNVGKEPNGPHSGKGV